MRIIAASETNGTITASVEFADGRHQTVVLPSWATKTNIKAEARRLRDEADARSSSTATRQDLLG